MMIIYGRNAVTETMRFHPESIKKIFFPKEDKRADSMRSRGFTVECVERSYFIEQFGRIKHQWTAADISPVKMKDVSDLEKESGGQYILLDSVQDPHNLGSVIRTAYGMGLKGVIITGDRTAEITASVYATSSGYVNALDIFRMKNPAGNIKRLKKAGFWILTVDMDGELELGTSELDLPLPLIICMGSEGKGVRETYRKLADYRASIPQREGFDSYNLSVASAVVMWEISKQLKP